MLISPVQAKENTSSNWMQSISGDTKLGALRFQVHIIQQRQTQSPQAGYKRHAVETIVVYLAQLFNV